MYVTVADLKAEIARLERRIQSGALLAQHARRHRAGGDDRLPAAASLTVRDIDGTPTVTDVDTIEFTNGAVTDQGGGVARVATGGGSGGHTIQEDGSGLTARANLNARNSIKASDDAGNNATILDFEIEIGTYASRPAASASVVGMVYMATDRGNTLYYCKDTSTWVVLNPRTAILEWYIDGRLRGDASTGQGPIRYLPTLDGMTDESIALWKPVIAKGHVRTAPAGASILIQIEYGTTATPGTDLFNAGDRIEIAAGGKEDTSTTFTDNAIENGTAFELVIDQVGSTAGSEGEDLTVRVEFVQIDA